MEGLQVVLSKEKRLETSYVTSCEGLFQELSGVAEKYYDAVLIDFEDPSEKLTGEIRKIKNSYQDVSLMFLVWGIDKQEIVNIIGFEPEAIIYKLSQGEEIVTALKSIQLNKRYLSPAFPGYILLEIYGKMVSRYGNDDMPLTRRELEILELISKGYTSKEIAERLFLSCYTVENHRKHMIKKTKKNNTAALVQWAIEMNLINP